VTDGGLVLVGAGRAGSSILRAVVAERLAAVRAIVDPDAPGRDLPAGIPTYPRLEDVPADLLFDVAVVAVPTPQHAAVLAELLASPSCPPLVLCEKPLTATPEDTRRVRDVAAARWVGLHTLLHFATAPEAAWLRDNLTTLEARLGPCVAIRSEFADDYCHGDEASARARLGSPWLDSGVNSLSVVLQVVTITQCVERREREGRAVQVRYRGERGEDVLVATAWDDPDGRKVTSVGFREGRVEVDHRRGTVALGDGLLFQVAAEPPTRRYGRLLAQHLGGERAAQDARLEDEVMSWLFARPTGAAADRQAG
jgi:predicted dehydrogenase